MKSSHSVLISRMVKAALKSACRYRVVAAAIDHRNRIISIASNTPRLEYRGYHAEERAIFKSPKSISRIIILRCGVDGSILPIDPCPHCAKIAGRRNIKIQSVMPSKISRISDRQTATAVYK